MTARCHATHGRFGFYKWPHSLQVAAVPESGGGLAHTSGSSLGEDGGPGNHAPNTETGAGGG